MREHIDINLHLAFQDTLDAFVILKIKNMLTRRKESDTYLATDSSLPLQLMKAAVPAESFTLYPLSP